MNNDRGRFIRKAGVWSAVVLLALGAAGCGGSSSSSDTTGNGGLSEPEQAALAALSGGASVSMAGDMAGDAGYEDDDSPVGMSGSSGPIALSGHPAAAIVLDCEDGPEDADRIGWTGEGFIYAWNDPDAEMEEPSIHYDGTLFDKDVGNLDDILTDGNDVITAESSGMPTGGNWFQGQQRADCSFSNSFSGEQTFRGAVDVIEYSGFSNPNNSASYIAVGAVDEDAPEFHDQEFVPDTSEYFSGGSPAGESLVRGEIRNCIGCPHGDLSNFSGDERDSAFVGFIDVDAVFPDGEGGAQGIKFHVGNGPQEPMSMTTAADDSRNPDVAHVLLNGRIAVEDMANAACSFDVSYSMDGSIDEGLYVENYSEQGGGDVQDGSRLTVTFTDSGNAYDVKVENDKQVYVREAGGTESDWDLIDLSDEEDLCGEPETVATAPSPEGNWKSECVAAAAAAPGESTESFYAFDENSVTLTAILYEDDHCDTEEESMTASWDYGVGALVPGNTPDAFELNLFNGASADIGDLQEQGFDIYGITEDGQTLYLGSQGEFAETEAQRPDSLNTAWPLQLQ